MAITLTPSYPIPGEAVAIGESSAVGEVQVFELTSAPSASTMALGFLLTGTDEEPTTPLVIAANGWQTDAVTFDEPGEYGVTVYDLRQFSGAPSFPGDPGGELFYQLIAVYTGTIYVAALMSLELRAEGGAGATLQLRISNETVRVAELVNGSPEAGRVAALQAAVVSALGSLVGDTVAAMGTDLQTGVNDLRAKYEAHRILTGGPILGVHYVADNVNSVDRGDADSQPGAISLLNELWLALLGHLQNSSAQAFGSRWHGLDQDDLLTLPIARAATDLATATVLSADLRERCYERHRALSSATSPASHNNADNTNVLAAPSDLDALIVAYFDALVEVNPSVVAGEPEGAVDAEHRYGFTRV